MADSTYVSGSDVLDIEKGSSHARANSTEAHDEVPGETKEVELHRGLKSRHISMIAIGGAIGTGLIIGSGSGLASGGPLSILIGYVITGAMCYVVMTALGEMATRNPIRSSFTGYATRFVDPALGFSLGWSYFCKYVFSTANQLTSIALVLQYWVSRDTINPGVFIAIFLVVINAINYFGVKVFGEAEFWLSSLKVLVLVGLIFLCIILACGGGPNHKATGFTYWSNPGAINPYIMTGATGQFLSVWNALTAAVYAYLGTELVGVAVGEAQNPRKTIPRAVKLTFWRISFFYITSIFLLGMLVPYNSPEPTFANKQTKTAAASPFVVAVQIAGVDKLPAIVNGCILIFNLSASNSDLYIATRTLYSLASHNYAPKIFAYTNRQGIPIWSLALSSAFTLLAFMNVTTSTTVVFGYFVNLATTFGLLMWITILISHIFFVRARKAQGIANQDLVYVAPLGIWGSAFCLVLCTLVIFTKSFAVFTHGSWGNFDYTNFITGYLAIPLYIGLYFGYKLWHKTHIVKAAEADLFTGKDVVDREEQRFLETQAEKVVKRGSLVWYYEHTLGWLF